jgi:hypothetical protein
VFSSDTALLWAREQATILLPPLGDRWLHVQGVVAKAKGLSKLFKSEDSKALLIAAYLHDIAYAPSLIVTGFHPIDGARYIEPFVGKRVADLVARHTQSHFEAASRGLTCELAPFTDEKTIITDALAYCDVFTDSKGNTVSLRQRREGVLARYGPDHIVYQSFLLAYPYLCLSVARIQRRKSLYDAKAARSENSLVYASN